MFPPKQDVPMDKSGQYPAAPPPGKPKKKLPKGKERAKQALAAKIKEKGIKGFH